MAIIHPLKPRMSASTVFGVIAVIWVTSIGVALPNLVFGSTFHVTDGNTVCYLNWPDGTHGRTDFVYSLLLLLVNYFVPLGILAVTYARVGCELWGSRYIGEYNQQQAENVKSKRRVEIVIPGEVHVPVAINDAVCIQPYWLAKDVPVVELININFIEAFVKRGQIYILSEGTKIDQHDCIAVLPTGVLVLHLTRDTYQELGINGRPSQYKGTDKFVVEINTTEPDFKPGKKFYERVKRCLDGKSNLTMDCIVTWIPHDDEISTSSISNYLQGRGVKCKECSISRTVNVRKEIPLPIIYSQKLHASDGNVGNMDFFVWQGAMSLGIDVKPADDDSYAENYACPEPSITAKQCLVCQYSGLISTQSIQKVQQQLREWLNEVSSPWVSFTVAGFQDSPVSWGRIEHGFHYNGDNLYSCVLFPDRYCWLYKVLGPNDRIS